MSKENKQAKADVATEPLVINTTNNKTEREMSITVDFPKTVAGCIEEFGEDVVHSLFRRQYKIDAQGKVRNLLGADQEGKIQHPDDEDVKKIFSEWKPGVKQEKRPSVDKVLKQAQKLSEEELEAMIQKIKANKA